MAHTEYGEAGAKAIREALYLRDGELRALLLRVVCVPHGARPALGIFEAHADRGLAALPRHRRKRVTPILTRTTMMEEEMAAFEKGNER